MNFLANTMHTKLCLQYTIGFPGGVVVKNSPANARDTRDMHLILVGKIPWSGNPLQNSCLGNPMDRGALQATVHGVTKSWTRLSDWACMHSWILHRPCHWLLYVKNLLSILVTWCISRITKSHFPSSKKRISLFAKQNSWLPNLISIFLFILFFLPDKKC